jgi:DNA-3-methyladenine glycosylase
MYAKGGTAYVYISYGLHHLFNVVTNAKEIPHAILIRAVEPAEGIKMMMRRRKMKEAKHNLSSGPGSMSVALGIRVSDSGTDLIGDKIWIEDRGVKISKEEIHRTIRIGVETSGRDARLPYRFIIKGNPWITRSPFNK